MGSDSTSQTSLYVSGLPHDMTDFTLERHFRDLLGDKGAQRLSSGTMPEFNGPNPRSGPRRCPPVPCCCRPTHAEVLRPPPPPRAGVPLLILLSLTFHGAIAARPARSHQRPGHPGPCDGVRARVRLCALLRRSSSQRGAADALGTRSTAGLPHPRLRCVAGCGWDRIGSIPAPCSPLPPRRGSPSCSDVSL